MMPNEDEDEVNDLRDVLAEYLQVWLDSISVLLVADIILKK